MKETRVNSEFPYNSPDELRRDERLVNAVGRNYINLSEPFRDTADKLRILKKVLGYTHLKGRQNTRIPIDECNPGRINLVLRDHTLAAEQRLNLYGIFMRELDFLLKMEWLSETEAATQTGEPLETKVEFTGQGELPFKGSFLSNDVRFGQDPSEQSFLGRSTLLGEKPPISHDECRF